MTKGAEAYETIASFYDAEHRDQQIDVAYFSRHCSTGSVLVLGCGTGRVGRVLGSERRVTGLDSSPAMLAIARTAAPHATYVLGDMCDFDLGHFGEVIIPNGAFNFLPTRATQARCLESCARALPPGGSLVIDMPMPDFTLLGTPHTAEKPAWEGTVAGEHATRTREVRRYPVSQRIELIERYYVGGALAASTTLPLRHVLPAEVEWMVESCGFAVEALHGTYAGANLTESSPRIIVRAMRL